MLNNFLSAQSRFLTKKLLQRNFDNFTQSAQNKVNNVVLAIDLGALLGIFYLL